MTATAPRITVGVVRARLEGSAAALACAREALDVLDPAAEYNRAYRSGRWDGVVHLMGQDGTFPAGLAWRVAAALRLRGLPPETTWPDAPFGPPLAPESRGMEDRAYQADAVGKWLRARRLFLQCPTRSGKTDIAIEGCRRIGGAGLWVTHNSELQRQTAQRFRDRLDVEVEAPDGSAATLRAAGPLVVGMVQSLRPALARDPSWFRRFRWLVADEGHRAGAPTWQAVEDACTGAPWRLALSGTASTGNPLVDLRIEGAFGPTYQVTTTSALADLGFVARPRIVFLRVPGAAYPTYEDVRDAVCPRPSTRMTKQDFDGWVAQISRSGGALYREFYQRGVVLNVERDRRVRAAAARHALAGERFLVLCSRVPHAEALAEDLRGDVRGRAEVWQLSGQDPDDRRSFVIDRFKATPKGSGAVLVATPFFREGVDAPQIDAGLLAGADESDVAVLQGLGRMLTARPDKPEVLIYDLADGRDAGAGTRAAKDYLGQHYLSRLALFRDLGFAVEHRAA